MKTEQFSVVRGTEGVFTSFGNEVNIAIIRGSENSIEALIIVRVFEVLIDID